MEIIELCKHCETCKDFIYRERTSHGTLVTFRYCKGIKEVIDQHRWKLHEGDFGRWYVMTSLNQYDVGINSFLRHEKINLIKYHNGPQDLRLRFLSEVYRTKRND